MNKKDLPVIIILFMLLVLWGPFSQKIFPPGKTPDPAGGTNVTAIAESSNEVPAEAASTTGTPSERVTTPQPVPADPEDKPPVADTNGPALESSAEKAHHASDQPELVRLDNGVLNLTVSSWGGCIVDAALAQYPQTNSPDSEPLRFDFATMPALAYADLPGLSPNYDFQVTASGLSATVTRTTEDGVEFIRTITLTEDGYDVSVVDRLRNLTDSRIDLPLHGIHLGPMGKIGTTSRRGLQNLNIDTRSAVAEGKVRHWASKRFLSSEIPLPASFQENKTRSGGCSKPRLSKPLPETIDRTESGELDWLAVKNKFFVQFLDLPEEDPADAVTLHAKRAVSEREKAHPDNPRAWDSVAALVEVAATAQFAPRPVQPGDTVTRKFHYYVGPKKYAILKSFDKVEIMELGWSGGFWGWLGWILSWLCPALIWLMNSIVRIIPSYGAAIILLTILIRLVFWPVMQKSTENMKKMQQIQPELQEIREKYKDDQQKLLKKQQELFKQHKVSPLGGCLPMLVQIPVFIGLFRVLRSAVELRFAPFLWIADLSEPEGLLAGILPFWPYQLNILPILMTVTMVIQQKMTPTAGDPQQQKMMAVFMPVMMLFLFYNMASALVLYWTTSQVLAILQLVLKNRKDKVHASPEPAPA